MTVNLVEGYEGFYFVHVRHRSASVDLYVAGDREEAERQAKVVERALLSMYEKIEEKICSKGMGFGR